MSEQHSSVSPTQGNIYAPPSARVDDVVPEGEFELAGRGTRFLAVIVDGLTPAIGGIIAAIAIPAMQRSESAVYIAGGLAVIAVLAVIVVNCMWIHQRGQTIGKRVMGIKTVRSDGSRCGLTRVFFLRYLPIAILGAIPYLGFVVFLVDSLLIVRESHKCLHDDIADTVVIKA